MSEIKKVIHLCASDSGGAYVFAKNLSDALNSADIISDVAVFSGNAANIKLSRFHKIDLFLKTSLHAFEKFIQFFYEKDKSVRFKYSLGFPGISVKKLNSLCQNYDIVHLHWINKGFININDLLSINQPIVWTCHDLWPISGGCHLSMGCDHFHRQCGNCHFLKKPSDADLSNKLHVLKSKIYPQLNLSFISPSAWMDRNIALSSLSVQKKHFHIQNGINTQYFKYKPQKEEQVYFKIGFVAANLNDKNKALFRLLEAIELLPDKSKIQLILVGQLKEKINLGKGYAYKLYPGITDKTEMALIYNEIDLLVCSSTIETFPTTLMEAYCCGARCIGFKVGGIPEILESMDDQCIEPFNIQELSNQIENLIPQTKNREAISKKAIQLFDIKHTAQLYANCYNQLLN